MSTINPQTMKHFRTKRGWTLAELAEKSKIHKSTIHRIEQGKGLKRGHNDHTIKELAKYLGCKPEELCGPITESEAPNDWDRLLARRSLPRNKMSDAMQNALHLVSKRYDVSPENILDFAPFFFALLAEESLLHRKMQLEILHEKRSAISELQSNFSHLTERLVNDWDAEDIEHAERMSIARRDILGSLIDQDVPAIDPRPLDYDLETDNPFVTFLRSRVQIISEKLPWRAAIEGGAYGRPEYSICEDEAIAFANGDEAVADIILSGKAKLADMPLAFFGADMVVERLDWLRERENAWRADFDRSFPEFAALTPDFNDGSENKETE